MIPHLCYIFWRKLIIMPRLEYCIALKFPLWDHSCFIFQSSLPQRLKVCAKGTWDLCLNIAPKWLQTSFPMSAHLPLKPLKNFPYRSRVQRSKTGQEVWEQGFEWQQFYFSWELVLSWAKDSNVFGFSSTFCFPGQRSDISRNVYGYWFDFCFYYKNLCFGDSALWQCLGSPGTPEQASPKLTDIPPDSTFWVLG